MPINFPPRQPGVPDTTLVPLGDLNTQYYWTGQQWISVGKGGGGASVTVQEDAPPGPAMGDLWYKPSINRLSIFNNSQWIWVNQQGSSIAPIKIITTSVQATTDWTGAIVLAQNQDNIEITLPQGTFQAGSEFVVVRTNEGTVTFKVNSGTLNTAPTLNYTSLAYKNSIAGAMYIGNDTWHLFGDLLPYEVADLPQG